MLIPVCPANHVSCPEQGRLTMLGTRASPQCGDQVPSSRSAELRIYQHMVDHCNEAFIVSSCRTTCACILCGRRGRRRLHGRHPQPVHRHAADAGRPGTADRRAAACLHAPGAIMGRQAEVHFDYCFLHIAAMHSMSSDAVLHWCPSRNQSCNSINTCVVDKGLHSAFQVPEQSALCKCRK